MNKYGLNNFHLFILDYTNKDKVLISEQYWLDYIQPEYNILNNAGNSSGYQHKKEDILKMKDKALGRKHSKEVRKAMSENRQGVNNNFYGHTHSIENKLKLSKIALNRKIYPRPGFKVEISDLELNIIHNFNSIREAARSLNINMGTIISREKRNTIKPYKNRYIIVIKRF